MKQPPALMPESFTDLEQLIAARHGSLSTRLKDIAAFVLAHPNTIALETVATVAEQARVPPSALVRFAQALGFDGFSDMQRLFRLRLVEQMPSYADRLAQRENGDAAAGDSLDRLAQAAHGDVGGDLLVGRQVPGGLGGVLHRRLDTRRRNVVHRDAVRRVLAGQRLRQGE